MNRNQSIFRYAVFGIFIFVHFYIDSAIAQGVPAVGPGECKSCPPGGSPGGSSLPPPQTQQPSQKSRSLSAYNTGNDYYRQGKWAEAERYYREAIRLDPGAPDAYNNLGVVLAHQGLHTEALKAYEQAIRLGNRDAPANLAELEKRLAQQRQAVIEEQNRRQARQRQAEEHEQKRRLDEAKNKTNRILDDLSAGLTSSPPPSGLTISQPSPADLRFMDPGHPLIIDPKNVKGEKVEETRKYVSLKTIEVPSPSGYKSEKERKDQVAKLSNKQIETEMARIKRTLEGMKKDFLQDPKILEDLLAETQEAERNALMAGFQLILGASLNKWEKEWDAYPRLKSTAEKGLRYLSYEEPVKKALRNPLGKEEHIELARVYLVDLYGTLREFDKKMISEHGPPVAQLADFVIEYSCAVAQWSLARGQINAIMDRIDTPGGKLKAQQTMKRLLEDLVNEQRRRKSGG